MIAEIKGSEFPEEVILVGGHLDSWDIGDGAHDDGAGVVHSMDLLNIFNKISYRPKRTIRVVLFMNEENGGRGSNKYKEIVTEMELITFLQLNLMRVVLDLLVFHLLVVIVIS